MSKIQLLQAILNTTPEAEGYPAAYIAHHRPDALLYTDLEL